MNFGQVTDMSYSFQACEQIQLKKPSSSGGCYGKSFNEKWSQGQYNGLGQKYYNCKEQPVEPNIDMIGTIKNLIIFIY